MILDSDWAAIYGVPTKMPNRAVQRNSDRFPAEFVFRLEPDEAAALRCQFGTLKGGRGQKPPLSSAGLHPFHHE